MTPSQAEDYMRQAKATAEMYKQVAIAAAMKLPMPEHAAAIKRAEKIYLIMMAHAASGTGGLIDPAYFDNSLKAHE